MKSKLLLAGCSLLLLPLIFAVPNAFAHEGEDHSSTTEAREHQAATREEAKTRVETRLDAAKKRVCENRTKNIEAIMARSVKRVEKHIALFDTIADRVQAFYEKSGKTVANYDTLVAAMDTAKSQAETALTDMKAAADVDCSSEDPKGEIATFKESHQTVLEKLKDYRTSVKNLIVAVRSAQSEGDEQ